jgi:NAD(P)-dependent dehydrogenase (short-subunit alcohol dehydrogenase family)
VSGAAGGIGSAVVSVLASEGVAVAGWDLPGSDFSVARRHCEAAGVGWSSFEVDVRERDAVIEAGRYSARLGRVRYGVNAIGIDNLQPTDGMPVAEWRRIFEVNTEGVLSCCVSQFNVIKEHGGAIVNIASISGMIVNRDCAPHAAYASSKAATVHLTRNLAVEWAKYSIRVNAVSPGYTLTNMTGSNTEETTRAFRAQSPMGRMAEPEEIARPVAFLLGSGASFINGVNLPIDGGVTLW